MRFFLGKTAPLFGLIETGFLMTAKLLDFTGKFLQFLSGKPVEVFKLVQKSDNTLL